LGFKSPLSWFTAHVRTRQRLLRGPLRVTNLTRGSQLASGLIPARTSAQRNRGLLGRQGLGSGEGLWIVPCQAVHTFFMRFPIDLVWVDRNLRVRKVSKCVGPWRVAVCFFAHSVLELPAGTASSAETVRGDHLELEEAAEPPQSLP